MSIELRVEGREQMLSGETHQAVNPLDHSTELNTLFFFFLIAKSQSLGPDS